jgi:hypothetical protein
VGFAVFAGEGALGAVLARNVVLLGGEFGLPLGVGFFNAAGWGRGAVVGEADNVVPGLHRING